MRVTCDVAREWEGRWSFNLLSPKLDEMSPGDFSCVVEAGVGIFTAVASRNQLGSKGNKELPAQHLLPFG